MANERFCYFCGSSLGVIEFKEDEKVCNGRNENCPTCGKLLWLNYTPYCRKCVKSLGEVTFSADEKVKIIMCPECETENWVDIYLQTQPPVLIFS